VIVLSDSPCERIGKWETCPILKRGQVIDVCLAGASVTKTAKSLGVSRVTVSKVMSAYTNHGSEEEQWAKINIDRKSSSYSEGSFRKIKKLL
jgi:predicted transcriptional regulator